MSRPPMHFSPREHGGRAPSLQNDVFIGGSSHGSKTCEALPTMAVVRSKDSTVAIPEDCQYEDSESSEDEDSQSSDGFSALDAHEGSVPQPPSSRGVFIARSYMGSATTCDALPMFEQSVNTTKKILPTSSGRGAAGFGTPSSVPTTCDTLPDDRGVAFGKSSLGSSTWDAFPVFKSNDTSSKGSGRKKFRPPVWVAERPD